MNMTANEEWYTPELHPSRWRKRSGDHPWKVEASRRAAKARSARDDDALLDSVRWLSSLATRAAVDQMGLDIGVPASPLVSVKAAVDAVKASDERFPNGPQAMSPLITLPRLATAIEWLDRLRSAGESAPKILEHSPYKSVQHLWLVCFNDCSQLISSMMPVRTRSEPRAPSDWMEKIHAQIQDALKEVDVRIFMSIVLDRCDSLIRADWEPFRSVDFEDDIRGHADHVVLVAQEEPPTIQVEGLWFGMFNPVHDGLTSADIYFGGAAHVTPGDEEWVGSLNYEPSGRYLHSRALARIYDLAYRESDIGNFAEFPLCLAYGLFLARECGTRYAEHSNRRIWVSAGFDSGDVVDVGWVGPGASG